MDRLRRVLAPVAAIFLLGVLVVVALVRSRGPQAPSDLVTAKVEFKDLQVKVVERGTLEAVDNHDVKCEVKAGSRGAPKILWVVDNGTAVQVGDRIVQIDDSYLQEQAQDKKIERDKAEADKIAAEQVYPVRKMAIDLAKQQLREWIEGDFPEQSHEIEGDIQTADSALVQEEDRAAWVKRMVERGFMTASQGEAEQANLMGVRLTVQKYQKQLKVLKEYTDTGNRQRLQAAITQAEVEERTAKANLLSAAAVFEQQEALYQDLLEQIKRCTVVAPHAGIVVYFVPEQTQMGSGMNQSIIAQGEPVQFGQTMLSIPDLTHMQVNVRIHEAFINNITVGLPATVRVDAVPGKEFQAKVKSVASVAAPQDWMSPDVKVYPACVEITEPVGGWKLKPGLSGVCTVFTEKKADHKLAIPVQAVLSPLEKGGQPRCLVETLQGPELRAIQLGDVADEWYVGIQEGVKEGERVILDPRPIGRGGEVGHR
jgi:HlyD family secretion protein